MKRQTMKKLISLIITAAMCLSIGYMTGTLVNDTASAESASAGIADVSTLTEPTEDVSPAIYVAAKTVNSVVGVITSNETWDTSSREMTSSKVSEGSGVCVKEGGYVLTNNHVVSSGSSYQVLMPSGEKVDAELIGQDDSTDLAVLRVAEEYRDQLTPVDFGSASELLVGSTVVAIGNPGGEVLANTVTQGVVSALERTSITSSNTSRYINYIQHDAAINNGNSGGGLFNYKGQLVGINTLKYRGSAYSSVSTEGLGFAIPVETVMEVSADLIEYGKVLRPQMGVTVVAWDGPDEPIRTCPPASVYVYKIAEGTPAETAGFKQYDFIYSVDGVRVKTMLELTAQLDQHEAGDTIEVVVVRYDDLSAVSGSTSESSGYFGNSRTNGSDFEFVTLNVTLEILDD